MSSILMLAIAIAGGLMVTGVWALMRQALWATASPSSPLDAVAPDEAHAAQAMFRAEARAATVAVVTAVGVIAIMLVLGRLWVKGYGLPYALAGTIAAVVGLLVLGLQPRPAWPSDRRGVTAAELVPRSATSFAAKWVFVLPLAASLALLTGLVVTGLYSATDANGLHRILEYRSLSGWGVEDGEVVDIQYNVSAAGPFPGWYYGLPLMICTLLLIGVVYMALLRTAETPRPATTGPFAVDTQLRAMKTRLIMSASTALFGFQIAGLAAITGNIFRLANLETIPTADMSTTAGTVPIEPGHTLSLVLILFAVVIAIASVVLTSKAVAVVYQLWAAGKTPNTPLHAQPAQ